MIILRDAYQEERKFSLEEPRQTMLTTHFHLADGITIERTREKGSGENHHQNMLWQHQSSGKKGEKLREREPSSLRVKGVCVRRRREKLHECVNKVLRTQRGHQTKIGTSKIETAEPRGVQIPRSCLNCEHRA